MTAQDSTPDKGNDGTADDYPPMLEADDFDVAMALEGRKEDARRHANDACRALLNDHVALDDQTVSDLYDAGAALTALADTLVHRIPREERGPITTATRPERDGQSTDR